MNLPKPRWLILNKLDLIPEEERDQRIADFLAAYGHDGPWFGIAAIRELKRDVRGHSHNAAKIHIAMVSMFVPFCLIVLVAHWGR